MNRRSPSPVPTVLVAAIVLLVVATVQPRAGIQAAPARNGVDFVVQGTVDSELQPLLTALERREQVQIAAWTFWRGRIGSKTVVVSRTEMGPINAAAATALAIVNFRPRLILNQGTAGATEPNLKVFDIVVGEATVDYGAFRSPHRDAGAGVDLSSWMPMPHRLRLDGKERIEFRTFPGDAAAFRTAMQTPYKRGRVVKGVIGSANEINLEIDRLTWIRTRFGAVSEDMESAFAAGVAAGFRTPFLAIRVISDSEFHASDAEVSAGEDCASFVLDVIKRIGSVR